MDSIEKEILEQIIIEINQLLIGNAPEPIHYDHCPYPLVSLVKSTNELIYSFSEIWSFILPLSQGILTVNSPKANNVLASPFKELHSQLRNLVWQVQQVAKGDYNQRVHFMGEFSEAFNQMIEALQEKDRVIQEHVKHLESEAQNLRENEARYASAVRNSPGGIYIFDPDTYMLLDTNQKFDALMGYRHEEILKLTVVDLYQDKLLAQEDLRHILSNSLHNFSNRWYQRRNGEKVIFDINTCWSTSGQSRVVIVTLQDVTDRNEAQETLNFLASHDALTSALNRFALEEHYQKMSKQVNSGDKGALVLLDVDNFKFINDTFGRSVGDMVLVSLVSTLKENLGDNAILARLGGDEFVILLNNVAMDEASVITERLRQAVESTKPSALNLEFPFNYTVSIGVAPIQKPSPRFQEAFLQADYALHQAKEQGRNRVSLVTNNKIIRDKIVETNEMMLLISQAIEGNKFVLYFQPIVDLFTGKTIHHEALMRIITDSGEIIYPGRAIPIAERFGLMSVIDKQIINLSFESLKKYPEIKLFINLSGASIGDDEIRLFIEESIVKSGLDPTRIGFEITETTAIRDLIRADKWIKSLKKLGCRFAIDDFGIGYASFSYLQYLPVDYIKIDGSYIRNIESNQEKRALVQAMYTVAHSLGKEVIAEFVENRTIVEILNEMQIGYGQGYYIGRPEAIPQYPMLNTRVV